MSWSSTHQAQRATASGERQELIERASYVLHQPSDSQPHDDHMHIRIYCSPNDRSLGCLDFGVMRWEKKDYKYEQRPSRVAVPRKLARDHLTNPLTASDEDDVILQLHESPPARRQRRDGS